MKKFWFQTILLCSLAIAVRAQKPMVAHQCLSPDQQLKAIVTLRQEILEYSLVYKLDTLIKPSMMGFVLKDNDSLTRFRVTGSSDTTVVENWKPIWGIASVIPNHYNELKLKLESLDGKRKMSVIFRCYNDGFAFRYAFPQQEQLHDFTIMSEESLIRFSGNWECWWSMADYNTQEKKFSHTPLDSAKHAAAPLTLRNNKGIYLCVHEAAIEDYSTMTLLQVGPNTYKVNLVPWADGSAVKTSAPMRTPWRVFFFATRAGALMESNLLLNLNEPCAIAETSWIKPMTYMGIWWEMHIGIKTWMAGPRHGATTERAKQYIDFAAKNGIGGVLVEGWNTGWENWGKKGAFDFVTCYPDFNLTEVANYARSKGISFIGHHETGGDLPSYEAKVDEAFALYQKNGIHAVKTGYAGSMIPIGGYHHGQCKVRHCNNIMRLAAKYQIMIDAHEPMVLSGLSRTWPNLMSAEAGRGMEYNAWSEGNQPSHTCTLPFTRCMAGPFDYTPGIFDIDLSFSKDRVKEERADGIKTAVHSTIANQLALMVVIYSPLQMAADLWENYEGNPAFSFIPGLPTSWDETRVIDAAIGEYILIARRKGNDWYVGAITNEKGRNLRLPMNFLKGGKTYKATIYQDGTTAHYENNPESVEVLQKKLGSKDILNLVLAPGGGTAIKIRMTE